MDHCVTGVAELTKAHVAQLDFLRAPLYILPSLLHLGIACTVAQEPKSKKLCTRKFGKKLESHIISIGII